jgi:hypothetical protein
VSISQTSGGEPFGRGITVSSGPAAVAGGYYYYSFQTDAQILVGEGRYPYIVAETKDDSTITMTCGILGDLVTPLQ